MLSACCAVSLLRRQLDVLSASCTVSFPCYQQLRCQQRYNSKTSKSPQPSRCRYEVATNTSCRNLMLIQDDDDDDHSGEDEDGIDSANSNVQYPSPRKSSSPAHHNGASQHEFRASPDGPRAVSDSDESGSLDSGPPKQLVIPATKTGAAKPNVPSPGALSSPLLCYFWPLLVLVLSTSSWWLIKARPVTVVQQKASGFKDQFAEVRVCVLSQLTAAQSEKKASNHLNTKVVADEVQLVSHTRKTRSLLLFCAFCQYGKAACIF